MTIPVILDTDIGTDIDDTWALAMLLRCPQLDLRLVTSTHGDTPYRAKVAARFLQIAGRSDVAIGIGKAGEPLKQRPQAAFVQDFALEDYSGKVHEDGVQILIDTVLRSDERVTIISIGPLTNIAEALRREPLIAHNARLIGMHGSVRKGYRGSGEPAAEYNVCCDVDAARVAFAADWEVTITPLDTCGIVLLRDANYSAVRDGDDTVARCVIENYSMWLDALDADMDLLERRSTTLFDTVAIYLAFSEELLEIEALGIEVTDDGLTKINESMKPIRVATQWRDLERFYELLVDKIVGR